VSRIWYHFEGAYPVRRLIAIGQESLSLGRPWFAIMTPKQIADRSVIGLRAGTTGRFVAHISDTH